ncbi:DUF4349 domain-containing protein [Mycobacterium sp. NBC_00419]|uniref:DUF4349 domain-containing protein n=1 Tax=Mycobacterium sp. NBC_00419 TaxID=2975989 RepID=UPI002E1BF45D
MDRTPPRLRIARWLVAALAVLSLLTACTGGPVRPSQAPAGTADAVQAPVPQDVPKAPPPVQRDVVKTAAMIVNVADPAEAGDKATTIVDTQQGRVDSRSEDAGSGTGRARTTMVLRVPAAKLDDVMRELKALGTVEHAEVTTDDVTAQRVDLDARIKALQTSVDRLLAIMRDAKDPEALIKAEDALSQRQADLDSLRAQREALGDQIAYSTVNVTFTAQSIGGPAPNQYQGFFGQVHRGWDAMVSLASDSVLLFGLLLPWLAVLAVAGGITYGLVLLVKRRRP